MHSTNYCMFDTNVYIALPEELALQILNIFQQTLIMYKDFSYSSDVNGYIILCKCLHMTKYFPKNDTHLHL